MNNLQDRLKKAEESLSAAQTEINSIREELKNSSIDDSPKVGEWRYYDFCGDRGIFKYNGKEPAPDGCTLASIFIDNEGNLKTNIKFSADYRPATESEIKDFLIKYCDSVYKGKKFKSVQNGDVYEYCREKSDYVSFCDTLYAGPGGYGCIYQDGKFAEVVEDKLMIAGYEAKYEDETFYGPFGTFLCPCVKIGCGSFTKREVEMFARLLRKSEVRILMKGKELTLKEVEQILKGFDKP